MDEIEIKPSRPEPELADLRAQLEALRHLVGTILVLLVVVSGTFNIYLLRQFRSAGKDLEGFRPYAQNILVTYQKGDGQAVENFLGKIVDYGRAHQDFVPILRKYNISPSATTSAPPATAAPTLPATKPGPAPLPKK